jgi:peptidoglycan-associated lipoprotein
MVMLDKDGMPTGQATNLGKEINTPRTRCSPSCDNGNLYFRQQRHPGMGGMDIYMAEKQAMNTWGHVENMKYP